MITQKKIGICGSQGTGKSTILRALYDMGHNTIAGNVARNVLKDWNTTLQEVYNDLYRTQDFQETILQYKQADEDILNPGLNFVERTYADLFSYAVLNLGKLNDYNVWLDAYYTECKLAQQTYSLIFYLPANVFTIENDGVRSINYHYGNSVDLILLHYLKKMSTCPVITLTSTSVSERIDEIKSVLIAMNLIAE